MYVLDMQQSSNDFSCWAGHGTTVTGSDGRSVFRNCPGSETVLVSVLPRMGLYHNTMEVQMPTASHHRRAWSLEQRAKRG